MPTRRKVNSVRVVLLVVVFILIIAGLGSIFVVKTGLSSTGNGDKEVVFTIENNESFDSVLEKLKKENLISNASVAKLYGKATHNTNFVAGTFELDNGMSVKDILSTIQDSTKLKKDALVLKIPEGKWAKEIAAEISNLYDGKYSSEEILNQWNDVSYIQTLAKDYSFLNFIRDIGKHITVNYMMAKDSVKKRLSRESSVGMSFTEFSYQLLQGYDYLYLYEHEGCRLQMGGTDQWGNITTGTELIRRTLGGEAYALTCPLITKADGGKFGKTESGNIWLDRRYTSPYKFYQFWLNVSDADAAKYIKIFTDLSQEEIAALEAEQEAAPHLRPLQKRLAKEVTVMVHSLEDYEAAVEASNILFGNSTHEALLKLDEDTLLAVFEGVPHFDISRDELAAGIKAVDLCTEKAAIFPSKGDCQGSIRACSC